MDTEGDGSEQNVKLNKTQLSEMGEISRDAG